MRLLAEDLQQRLKVHPVDMLRIERQPLRLQPAHQFRMHGTKPANGGEQPQRAAAGRQHQRRHRRRRCLRALALEVVDHKDAGLFRIVEGRVERRAHRWMFKMQRPGHGQRRFPACCRGGRAVIGRCWRHVAKCRRGDGDPVGRLQHRMGKGDRRVEPVPRHPDIAVCAVDAVDLHPVDKAVGRAGQRPLQKPLPARYRARGAKLEAANGAFEPRAFG